MNSPKPWVVAHGMDVYFDLIGGEVLHSVATPLATGRRVILCGLIAEVNMGTAGLVRIQAWGSRHVRECRAWWPSTFFDLEARQQEFVNLLKPFITCVRTRVREHVSSAIESALHPFRFLI